MSTAHPRDGDELLDIVDDDNRVVGQAPRAEATARRLCHRVTGIRVLDGRGRQFVHRRTPEKLVHPSLYDMFVGGVVGAGESCDEAALREAEEELGVSGLAAPTPLFDFRFESPEHLWWFHVYEARWDGPVSPQPEEVAWHTFLTPEELESRLDVWEWVPDGLEAHLRLTGRLPRSHRGGPRP